MNATEADPYKRLLLAKRDELLPPSLKVLLTAGREEGHAGDPTDRATEEAMTALQVRLTQSDSHLLRAIEAALARIEHGTFGVCEACKRPIARARLRAVPWTRLCRDCKEQGQA
jgi:DnaK suppressor protein